MNTDYMSMAPGAPSIQCESFRFAVNNRPLIGAMVAAAMIVIGLGVARPLWNGRAINGELAAISALVLPLVFWRQLREHRQFAANLGHIEIDDTGLRWLRPNQEVSLNLSWGDVERATFDTRNFAVLLFRRNGGPPCFLGAIAQHGFMSRVVMLERFDELVKLISRRMRRPTTLAARLSIL